MFDIGRQPLSSTCVDYLGTLKEMCGNEVHAYTWLEQVIQTALIWDHLADGDQHDKEALDSVFMQLVTEWPLNPFLRKYAECLIPTVVASISAWRQKLSRDLDYSVYREVPCAVAFIIGGNALASKFMPKISQLVLQMRLEDDRRDEVNR